MLLKRFYDDELAQASYLIGCAATGEALVVDPNRDVRQYEAAAAAEKLRVTHVAETHIHADFVSGSRELAARTGAQLLLSGEGGSDWQYVFAAADGARLLRDGDQFMVGNLRLDVLHTPGHTPEHLSFVVTDTPATDQPMGVLTGDFVFVGDVGRPDLLERAAGVAGTMADAARTLFRSLQRFATLPDHLQLWPGHGAGSACGKALGAVPSSTLGYERIANWAFGVDDEARFVALVLDGQPEPPRYFARMKRVNRDGPSLVGDAPAPVHQSPARLGALLADAALVVDVRPATEYAAAHVPGTINIPLNRSFLTWAGWLLPYDRDVHLLTADAADATADRAGWRQASRALSLIGLDRVVGWFGADALDAWRASGRELGRVPQLSVQELAERRAAGTVTVVDVRNAAEWEAGHLAGARHIPLGQLAARLHELPADEPIVVHCQGGGRSAIAASLLRAHGVDDVTNLAGGYAGWRAAGLPVQHDDSSAAATTGC